jgi:hypothetical protein
VAEDKERPAIIEQQWVLDGTIQARCDAYEARQAGDLARATEIEVDHGLWLRRMRAARAALDASGLHHGRADVDGRTITIFATVDSVNELDPKKPEFMRALRRELGSLKAKVRFTLFIDLGRSTRDGTTT